MYYHAYHRDSYWSLLIFILKFKSVILNILHVYEQLYSYKIYIAHFFGIDFNGQKTFYVSTISKGTYENHIILRL